MASNRHAVDGEPPAKFTSCGAAMEQVVPPRDEHPSRQRSSTAWKVVTALLIVVAAVLLLLVLRSKLQGVDVPRPLMVAVIAGFCTVIFLGTCFLVRALREYRETTEWFEQMATNIREIFWMLDAETKKVLYVNEAYETITGRSCRSLLEDSSSDEDLIYPEDRAHVLARLAEATETGQFDERFRIVCTDGEVRWVKVHGSPVRDTTGKIRRLVGTAQEITAQKQAEDQTARSLAEADALRKATLALTQDLRMNFVMDALLQSLAELIPYTCARVMVPEGGPNILALCKKLCPEPVNTSPGSPLTLNADESPFLQRILAHQKSILISDTKQEDQWQTFKGHRHLRSWLCVPLVASDQYLGFLSVGHNDPNRYTSDDLRRAELLAIPAAAAIQNARLYARADIYASELQSRLSDLRLAEVALDHSEESRRISEEKFQKVFRASPIPFSITTVNEGRFVDVNTAFERRYGYSRSEVIGRTILELGIWEDPSDRVRMTTQLQQGPIRNVITRLRTKSGESKLTAYSADKMQFDGQACVLAVSEDIPQFEKQTMN